MDESIVLAAKYIASAIAVGVSGYAAAHAEATIGAAAVTTHTNSKGIRTLPYQNYNPTWQRLRTKHIVP